MREHLPLAALEPSATNPRRLDVSDCGIEELAASVRAHGILQPILVRPHPKKEDRYVIVCGHRRWSAAKAAGLETIPATISKLTDQEALELQLVENLQRADLHPLEEAQGYHDLSRQPGYDVAKIAARVGRSVKYVYDRVKLLALTKEAKALFWAGKFTAGHAILLARLKPADQARALATDRIGNGREGGIFAVEHLHQDPFEEDEAKRSVKPRSVRELESWIDDNVRFEPTAADPLLFPETAVALQDASTEKRKVVLITHDYHVPEGARGKERTHGPMSWRRADGELAEHSRSGKRVKSRTCEKSELGVIAVGPGRGDAFQVCVDRTCEIHFPRAAKTARKKAGGAVAKPAGPDQLPWELRRKALAVAWARWKAATPRILKATRAAVLKAPAGAQGPLAGVLLRGAYRSDEVPRGRTAEDLVRHLAYGRIQHEIRSEHAYVDFRSHARALGINLAGLLRDPAAQTSAKRPVKKAARRKKGRR
jgi:ParB/RepB/Spo0J family partition protein